VAIRVTPLTEVFAAEIAGVDIARPVDDATWAEIRAAFEEHSVLVFRRARLDDETQVAFSRRFGALEITRSMNPAAGTPFARQSNLDIKTGGVIPPDDRRMVYQLANMLWHSDSSFKAVPSLCSLLSARIVPPEGGATEFASTRAAYPSLPAALKRRVEHAIAVHDFSWSRDQVRPGFFTAEERAVYPPVRHPLVRVNPVNGRSVPLPRRACVVHRRPADRRRPRAARRAARARDAATLPLSARVDGGRPRHLGQPLRAASGDAVRQRAPPAAPAAYDRLRRSRRVRAYSLNSARLTG
jgi:alpha-ketoglutarate-dependent 2,4-dichlorophenoxyacetate dioxygenase